MEIRISRDERGDRKPRPIVPMGRETQEGREERQRPQFPDEAVEGSLAEELAALGEDEHEDDLQDGGRDGEHVGVEGGEAEAFEREGQVCLDWALGDVGDQPDEVETPHGLVAPCVEHVSEVGAFVDVCETLGGVVAEEALFVVVSWVGWWVEGVVLRLS